MLNIKDLKVTTKEGLSVKNYKTFPSHEWGEDGGMQADVYLNGVYVGQVYDAGDGGMGSMDFNSNANIKDFKNAVFNFLKRKDKNYFKYSFMPKQASDVNEDDYVCMVDLIAHYYNKKARVI